MCEVTFTPEQVREIRRRIEAVPFAGRHHAEPDIYRADVLAAFPLKVTRYRTFEAPRLGSNGTYRVVSGRVEYCNRGYEDDGGWVTATQGESVEGFAGRLAGVEDWRGLAALADVAARPTEEVPDDGR